MHLNKLIPVVFIAGAILFAGLIVYSSIFSKRAFETNETLSKILIIAEDKPYYHYTGSDNPYYYVIRSQNYSNDFRISDEVLDLVNDNDSISKKINEIKYGDTVYLYLVRSSFDKLNQTKDNIQIVGLESNHNVLIDPNKLETYYKKHKADNIFSLIVITVILFFIFRKKFFEEKKIDSEL